MASSPINAPLPCLSRELDRPSESGLVERRLAESCERSSTDSRVPKQLLALIIDKHGSRFDLALCVRLRFTCAPHIWPRVRSG